MAKTRDSGEKELRTTGRLCTRQRREQRGERERQPDIVGEALLEAELAGHEAADQLEAPGAEDGGETDPEDDRGCEDLMPGIRGHASPPPQMLRRAKKRSTSTAATPPAISPSRCSMKARIGSP